MRLFIAIDLPEEIRKEIYEAAEVLHVTGIKPVEKENLHITLKFLGEVPDHRIKDVLDLLDKLEHPTFRIEVKGVGAFPDVRAPRVLWVGAISQEIYGLKAMINGLFGRDKQKFHPHITVARVKRFGYGIKEAVRKFMEKNRNRDFGSFTAENVVLKRSILTPKGPIYEDVKVVELGR